MLFSLVLALMATGLQVVSEYHHERRSLVQLQSHTLDMLAPNISRQLWSMDYPEIQQTLEGTLALPGISHLRIASAEGRVLEAGRRPESHLIEQQRSLSYVDDNGQLRQVGTLRLSSSYASALDSIVSRTLLTLITQGLIIFAGAIVLLIVVRQTLTRHLETMADYARRLTLNALIEPLQLKRTTRRPDELTELERALNTMRLQLLQEARDIQHSDQVSRGERDLAVRANQAKTLFVASVSHGLRTPLQSVLGFATLLQEAPLDDEQREHLRLLTHSAENLSALINDLLDISRMEKGRLELDQLPFDIREVIDDVMMMLSEQARERGLTLERRVDPHVPERLSGDPMRLRQILINLVTNGIQFTDQGHVLIGLELLSHQGEKARLRLSVEDTGIGIASQDRNRIYKPHVQLPTDRQPGNGIGLGLTICRHLLRLMGSDLQLQSSPGQGSTFWMELTLPLAEKRHSTVRTPSGALKGRHLLVVDAYPLSRKITLELLARSEAHLDAVGSGAEALQRLLESQDSDSPYDLVVVDGFLPDMEADRLCQQLRQLGGPQLQILALSTHPQRGDAEHFRQAGANGFLSKTLRETYLLALLQQMMANAASGQPGFITRFGLSPPHHRGSGPHSTQPFYPLPVLLVEDNPVNRQSSRHLLEQLGCQVTTADSGEQALSLFRPGHYRLVLMDRVLPAMDGLATTRQWRELEQRHGGTAAVIIGLSASVMAGDEAACLEAGMNGFIPKPVNRQQLESALAAHFSPERTVPQAPRD